MDKFERYVGVVFDNRYKIDKIIGVGGMMNEEDAKRMFEAGASLVQCYSAMVYEGPAFPGRLCRRLATPTAKAK